MTDMPMVMWTPAADAWEASEVGRFASWLAERGRVDAHDYETLRQWSVDKPAAFWQSIAEFFDVHFVDPWTTVRTDDPMPGTRWFTGSTLNYAEHMLRTTGDAVALHARSHTREPFDVTCDELRDQVGRARAGLRRLGVGKGDRVVAYAPNVPETLVVFLAAASLGAIWASCSPEFGPRSVADRFSQIEPKVLVTIDGYRHNGKAIDRTAAADELVGALPSVTATVTIPYLDPDAVGVGPGTFGELIAEPGELAFDPVPFDHPLYVLFSSGTTGLPKPIVHGHGGITIEHFKFHGLHGNLKAGDTLFQPATTAWMVWNSMISALMVGASIVMFDGDVTYPDLGELWRVAASADATNVGTAAMLLDASAKSDLSVDEFRLPRLRSISSTGSPLSADAYEWVYREFDDVILSSQSGGTDVCAAFVGGVPVRPVVRGEITCRMLGIAVEAFDPDGRSVVGEQGELVIIAPMPSMPVGFWGDEDGSRYRKSYFEDFPGVWRHGDWITITDRGTAIISGRSDATLNRGGIRLGTGEFYSVVDPMEDVLDSVVVHVDVPGTGGRLVLLVSALPDVDAGELASRIRGRLKVEQSPRHIPEAIYLLPALPRTLTGKRLEVPIKRILDGADPSTLLSPDAITHGDVLPLFVRLASEDHAGDIDLRGVPAHR